jgi:hypothetical protein
MRHYPPAQTVGVDSRCWEVPGMVAMIEEWESEQGKGDGAE